MIYLLHVEHFIMREIKSVLFVKDRLLRAYSVYNVGQCALEINHSWKCSISN